MDGPLSRVPTPHQAPNSTSLFHLWSSCLGLRWGVGNQSIRQGHSPHPFVLGHQQPFPVPGLQEHPHYRAVITANPRVSSEPFELKTCEEKGIFFRTDNFRQMWENWWKDVGSGQPDLLLSNADWLLCRALGRSDSHVSGVHRGYPVPHRAHRGWVTCPEHQPGSGAVGCAIGLGVPTPALHSTRILDQGWNSRGSGRGSTPDRRQVQLLPFPPELPSGTLRAQEALTLAWKF